MTLVLDPLSHDAFRRPFTGRPVVIAADAASRHPRRTADGRTIARGIRPSAAVEDAYRARLLRLVDEMGRSVQYWLGANYRKQDERIAALSGLAEDGYNRNVGGDGLHFVEEGRFYPHGGVQLGSRLALVPSLDPTMLAMDAPPSAALQVVVDRLRRRWIGRFEDASFDLARYFAKQVHRRTDAELRKILKRAGISVEFRISREVRDALRAVVGENVSLIRSIPEQYLTQVEGSVMRSVLAGRDLKALTDDLQHQHGVTRRRAEFISLDQNNKATSSIQRLQYIDLGIERAIWHHSHAGKEPRPTHLANDGKEFDVRTGWYDPAVREHIQPGYLPRCRCFSSPILPR